MTDVVLSAPGQRARVTPLGGRVVEYDVLEKPVLAWHEPETRQHYRSSLLAPWSNRVADGSWTWQGERLRLPVNEPDRGTALHGLVAWQEFVVEQKAQDLVELALDLDAEEGYPFPLRIEATYELGPDGLSCALRARNTGTTDAPVALGVHPYVRTGGAVDEATLHVPARVVVDGDCQWVEKRRLPVEDTDLDFTSARRIGDSEIDACWSDLVRDPDGRVTMTVRLADGDEVRVGAGRRRATSSSTTPTASPVTRSAAASPWSPARRRPTRCAPASTSPSFPLGPPWSSPGESDRRGSRLPQGRTCPATQRSGSPTEPALTHAATRSEDEP